MNEELNSKFNSMHTSDVALLVSGHGLLFYFDLALAIGTIVATLLTRIFMGNNWVLASILSVAAAYSIHFSNLVN